MKASRIDVLKFQLRCRLLKRLKSLTRFDREKKNHRIFERLAKTIEYRRARMIFAYMALPSEVQTREIIEKSLMLRKRVFLPAVNPKTKEIVICEIWNLKDLKKGPFGIWEPLRRHPGKPEKLDLVIVPALGFDKSGMRLGRGEGYFDRFLPRTKKAVKIGLAFKEQVIEKIPSLKYDIPVHKVITD